jgi:uncharacterized membrane protein
MDSSESGIPDASEPAGEPPRRLRKRIVIPTCLLVILVGLMIWGVIRGNWADPVVKNPATSSDGIVTQLYQEPDGTKLVRCAVVLEYPIDDVWSVVTDYLHFSEIFSHVCHTEIHRDADGLYHLKGTATAGLIGEWPFEVAIRHTENAKERTSLWDNPSEQLRQNSGSWTLTSLDTERTLVVYSLSVQAYPYPDFLVRNAFLSKLPGIVDAVAREVGKRHGRRSS